MTKSSLHPGQRRTVEIIEALGFGSIDQLLVRDGIPQYEPEPRIIQTIKLDSRPMRAPDSGAVHLTLKKEFDNLFRQLSILHDAVVGIEVRHSIPVGLVIHRKHRELVP